MIINLSPKRLDVDEFTLVKEGNTLTINNVKFDFSRMVEGDRLPHEAVDSSWVVDEPVRVENGVLIITVVLPNPVNYSPEQAFPVPLVDVPDGPVALPQPLTEQQMLDKLAEERVSYEQSHDLGNEEEPAQ